jgi:glycosyltransferase involved in cell wall biosynthesis
MRGQRVIALLGRRDTPTDAVEEYCQYLGDALEQEGYDLLIERVEWNEEGYSTALSVLKRKAKSWKGLWVLVQYTALAWSSRGFPIRFTKILKILRDSGAFVVVVFHDVEPYAGKRIVDRVRRRSQLRTMRGALQKSEIAVLTVPAAKLSWIKRHGGKTVFIPVGANLPVSTTSSIREHIPRDGRLGVAVYGVTGGKPGIEEIKQISEAVRFAAARVGPLRLIVLGRNSRDAEGAIQRGLAGADVELTAMGVLASEDVVRCLSVCDVLLFVRGHISTRRGSAIAGIACGLPVIAFAGSETAAPITEAGIALYSPAREGELGEVLARVLGDEHYRATLARQSWLAQREYFSWRAIAERYAEFLKHHS